MEEFSAEYFKKLAHDIMFDLNDEEVSELQEEFKVLLQQIELLDGIDTCLLYTSICSMPSSSCW